MKTTASARVRSMKMTRRACTPCAPALSAIEGLPLSGVEAPLARLAGAASRPSGLLEGGVVGWLKKNGFHLGHNPSVGFRFRRHLLPLGIGPELRPVIRGLLAARM